MALNIVNHIDDQVHVDHVLISVSDKQGLEAFAARLVQINPDVTIYSTGGTYQVLSQALGEKAALTLIPVSDYTGQPETQGGLVKTLDFKIYLGLLTETYNESHQSDLERVHAVPIDMVIVNLYPFAEAVSQDNVSAESARTHIDIGGPCMIRASAKNYLRVTSVTDAGDYQALLSEMSESDGCLSLKTRFEMSRKAFAHTAAYDAGISQYLSGIAYEDAQNCYTLS